jgi:hypothetical protein
VFPHALTDGAEAADADINGGNAHGKRTSKEGFGALVN